MALRISLMTLGRVRPDLDALTCERCTVACASYRATHPEATTPDPTDDRCAGTVVVGAAPHRGCGRKAFCLGGKQHASKPRGDKSAARGDKTSAIEHNFWHIDSSSQF
jgi:hypothetical protein